MQLTGDTSFDARRLVKDEHAAQVDDADSQDAVPKPTLVAPPDASTRMVVKIMEVPFVPRPETGAELFFVNAEETK